MRFGSAIDVKSPNIFLKGGVTWKIARENGSERAS